MQFLEIMMVEAIYFGSEDWHYMNKSCLSIKNTQLSLKSFRIFKKL